MIALPDLLTRMQSHTTGCVAVLLVDLRDGAVMDSCGDDAPTTAGLGGIMRRIMRDLVDCVAVAIAAPQQAILPGAGMPQEVILLSDDCTYVCGRLVDPPHHAVAAICRSTQNVGMIVALLRHEIEPEKIEAKADA
jgi:hypothetical protein